MFAVPTGIAAGIAEPFFGSSAIVVANEAMARAAMLMMASIRVCFPAFMSLSRGPGTLCLVYPEHVWVVKDIVYGSWGGLVGAIEEIDPRYNGPHWLGTTSIPMLLVSS